jgi:divalent metal cation (Fe/Co/Zn/Cd) transporter
MTSREAIVSRGLHLEYFTLGWNTLEALVALIAGWLAGSIALVGFGLDSVIEVSSGGILLWRLRSDSNTDYRERAEQRALRLVGLSFFALAAYLIFESGEMLLHRQAPQKSIPGIVLAMASLIAMPLLARAKRRVARDLGSQALRADSKQTDICAYLSAIMLGGLLLNAILGWWWADPVAGLAMTPFLVKEGTEAVKGRACCQEDACIAKQGATHVGS